MKMCSCARVRTGTGHRHYVALAGVVYEMLPTNRKALLSYRDIKG